MVTTGYQKSQADLIFGTGPFAAAFTWDGTTARSRLLDGSGSIIATSTNAATALNAAVTSIGGTPGGGAISVFSDAGPIPITSPIVLPTNVQLVGSGASYLQTSTGGVGGNSILKATGAGMTTSNAIIQSTGASGGPTSQGIAIVGIGLDGNNQTQCWDTINCNAPVISSCVAIHGRPYVINIRSDIAPNPLPGGGFAAQIWDSFLHGPTSGGGTAIMQSNGTGSTDGRMINCHLRLGSLVPTGVYLGGGGWIVEGCHLFGDSTATSVLVSMQGANCTLVGSDLRDASNGNAVIVGGPKMVVSGNYIYSPGATGTANAGIRLDSGKGSCTGNTIDTGGTGIGLIWTGSGNPPASAGVIALNHTIGTKGLVDSGGTTMSFIDGSGSYIQGNTVTAT